MINKNSMAENKVKGRITLNVKMAEIAKHGFIRVHTDISEIEKIVLSLWPNDKDYVAELMESYKRLGARFEFVPFNGSDWYEVCQARKPHEFNEFASIVYLFNTTN